MANNPRRNPNVPAIPVPTPGAGLFPTVRALKDGVESLSGQRGSILDRAVTFNDLVRMGLITESAATSPTGSTTVVTVVNDPHDYAMPEDYGAIGDGTSRPGGTHLGVATLAELRAYNGGMYSFATALDDEMDWLAWQAALYSGKVRIQARDGRHYILNRMLHNRNAHIAEVDLKQSTLDFSSLTATPVSTDNLITNGTFADGTGWSNTSLEPNTDFVFGGGAATFTDAYSPSSPNSFGQFGQEVTISPGKWQALATCTLSDGVSDGILGRPYIGMGFFSGGVGLGGYDYTHPLYRSVTLFEDGPETISIEFEIPEGDDETTWLVFTGGNANVTVEDVVLRPFSLNCAIWADPKIADESLADVDACWWRNGDIVGPGMTSGVKGFYYVSFNADDTRMNHEDINIRGFSGGRVFSHQAYLNIISRGNTGECDPCIESLPGSVNAGENMRFSDHIFYNSGTVLRALGGMQWMFHRCSWDYSEKYVEAARGAVITCDACHFESHPPSTTLRWSGGVSPFIERATLTGGTSGATGTIIDVNPDDETGVTGELVLSVDSGTFVDGEALTDSVGGEAVADGPVAEGGVMWELRGGSTMVITSGYILFSGAGHLGAQYSVRVATTLDTLGLPPAGYNLKTASGVLGTGAGRIWWPNGHVAPGNALLPELILRNFNADAFGGSGRIAGDSTASDMAFAGPTDGVGLVCALYTDSAPSARLVTPFEGGIYIDATEGPEPGYSSLWVEYDGTGGYDGEASFRLFAPVREGKVALLEYQWRNPTTYTDPVYGPFTSGAPAVADTIFVNTVDGSMLVTVEDMHIATLGGFGPQAGWTVMLSGVTGDPGGIPNATFNTTHTIVERTGDNTFTINVGVEATSTATDAGGAVVVATYTQKNWLCFFRAFWVNVIHFDEWGRPVIGQEAYQGEDSILVPAAENDWTRQTFGTWYAEAATPTNDMDRIARGRAPSWATHIMWVWDYYNIRHLNLGNKASFRMGHFISNII